jgi:hypothetical protein
MDTRLREEMEIPEEYTLPSPRKTYVGRMRFAIGSLRVDGAFLEVPTEVKYRNPFPASPKRQSDISLLTFYPFYTFLSLRYFLSSISLSSSFFLTVIPVSFQHKNPRNYPDRKDEYLTS